MKQMLLTRLSLLLLLGSLFFAPALLPAQSTDAALQTALDHLRQNRAQYHLTEADLAGYEVSSQYASRKSGVTHIYLNQTHQGIEVIGATANANLKKDGSLANMHVRFIPNLASKVENAQAILSAEQAVRKVGEKLGIAVPTSMPLLDRQDGPAQAVTFDNLDYAGAPVEVHLVFHFDKESQKARLAWSVQFEEATGPHVWNAHVDAATGKILFMKDLVLHCDFGSPALAEQHEHLHYEARSVAPRQSSMLNTGAVYRVFEMPTESPNHGPHVLVPDPSDPIASPYGWHDFDGMPGSESTITFGNNVHAYQDTDNINESSGDEPDGGTALNFDFPYNPTLSPEEYLDASVVNLFYWNNIMHDVWYQYGFDEPSGNFQANNYGNGGVPGDYVEAQSQDGGGTNNANFFTPQDGNNPRMQMYLWGGGGSPKDLVTVVSPAGIAGIYQGVEASFGPGLPFDVPIAAELVLADDGTPAASLACADLVNAADMAGKIALIDRGTCTFVTKIENAQEAGAIAVILCNNSNTAPTAMGGDGSNITIPSLMMYKADCDLIKTEIANGVQVELLASGPPPGPRDSGFDSGIICHEYGHGISIRLTGGPNATNCLWNDEQMGEGWSDYVGLMLTMKETDQPEDVRGIGTFAVDQPTTGDGIRPAPYTTDMNINPYTYGDTNDDGLSQPHGVGFVWASAIWDMTWGLIDEYGFDPDFYYGNGGNNIAMQLVTEGMKLQPCQPGFIDGRDAILLADQLLYEGANQCIIWDAFARRGMGLSATQGDTNNRFDQVEAFDKPNLCLTPNNAPIAAFEIEAEVSCSGFFAFKDQSTEIPQLYLWDFGDGNTSTEASPTHVYTEEGTYQIVLTVTNSLGESTDTKTVVVDFAEPPAAEDVTICKGQPAVIQIDNNSDSKINWYKDGILVFVGNQLITSPLFQDATFFVESAEKQPGQSVGPATTAIGPGSMQSSPNFNGLTFEVFVPMVIESVLVQADTAGVRTIQLLSENGELLQTKNVFIPAGETQISLEIEIDEPGFYQIGGVDMALYRNLFGGNFPYAIPGMMAITGTTNSSSFYYYFYNWVVRKADCISEQVPLTISVVDEPVSLFDYEQSGVQFLFQDQSEGATSWLWDFGNGSTSTAQNPIHWYWEEGSYEVTLTAGNGSCEAVYTQTVQVTNVSTTEIEGLQSFDIRPTVSDGAFFLSVQLDQPQMMDVTVFNAIGQPVYQQAWGQGIQIQEAIDLTNLAAGVYFVQLNVEGQTAVKRYVLVD